ncbi:4'-phosphopantetheinyl transferase family protein [Streptosporangium lutulentum]|uniref:4'-phosphopantetheinyl transferase EntD n=1 Tax=Streptosporangium lutulentum TaxID=1461250 RepID=A0ABT9Q4P5_9ACTN|nr:4'-phosphopantetheinyl transferase superfamily protein [Streptosporangium lutulentum]MDP9841710.1 4'-phosphopantetheinyl transferase EntD [Streptosporangium lutulentum]
MIESILPGCVVAADLFHDPLDATLFPEEEKVIEQAVEKRRREFTTARVCARAALGRLGLPATPVLPGLRGEPQWPKGVVGSITHCAGYRGAVLGTSSAVTAIGIDAEPNTPLANGVLEAVSLPEERTELRLLSAGHPQVSWDKMLFSAKESVYKAWFPLARRWLDFEDAVISFDPVAGAFSARLLVTGPKVDGRRLSVLSGRWLVDRGLIVTAIVIPR